MTTKIQQPGVPGAPEASEGVVVADAAGEVLGGVHPVEEGGGGGGAPDDEELEVGVVEHEEADEHELPRGEEEDVPWELAEDDGQVAAHAVVVGVVQRHLQREEVPRGAREHGEPPAREGGAVGARGGGLRGEAVVAEDGPGDVEGGVERVAEEVVEAEEGAGGGVGGARGGAAGAPVLDVEADEAEDREVEGLVPAVDAPVRDVEEGEVRAEDLREGHVVDQPVQSDWLEPLPPVRVARNLADEQ